jgi:toxin ParE1/3/4
MGRYFLSSRADADMLMVWEYIAQDSINTADRMIDQFTEAFERIAQFPESGERYEYPKGELRRVVVSPYLIFYRVTGDEVQVLRVLHSARKWEELL